MLAYALLVPCAFSVALESWKKKKKKKMILQLLPIPPILPIPQIHPRKKNPNPMMH